VGELCGRCNRPPTFVLDGVPKQPETNTKFVSIVASGMLRDLTFNHPMGIKRAPLNLKIECKDATFVLVQSYIHREVPGHEDFSIPFKFAPG
jgi:hypothetical protein